MTKKTKTKVKKSNPRPRTKNHRVTNAIKKINVLILGSGYPKYELAKRIKIKDQLKARGVNASIM